jgi:hypothetical protein
MLLTLCPQDPSPRRRVRGMVMLVKVRVFLLPLRAELTGMGMKRKGEKEGKGAHLGIYVVRNALHKVYM